MPGFQGKYFVFTCGDSEWEPKLSETLAFVNCQPEQPEGKSWHQQGTFQVSKPMTLGQAGKVLGFPKIKKGDTLSCCYRVMPRNGTLGQNLMYCGSTWYCRTCHVGDAAELYEHAEVKDLLPKVAPRKEEHEQCEGFSMKHKVGPAVVLGTPLPEGRGRKTGDDKGQGNSKTVRAILEGIKQGMGYVEINEQWPEWASGHNQWVKDMVAIYKVQPTQSKFTMHQCCAMLRQHPIDFGHVDWNHSVVVVGNAGIGKTEWALAHFKSPLLVNCIDKLRAFCPVKFDGIVFDDMSFKHWPVESQIHITDWTQGRDINCRYFNGFIPAFTKKIFTCNWDRFPFADDSAVNDRLCVIETDKELVTMRKRPPARRKFQEVTMMIEDGEVGNKKLKAVDHSLQEDPHRVQKPKLFDDGMSLDEMYPSGIALVDEGQQWPDDGSHKFHVMGSHHETAASSNRDCEDVNCIVPVLSVHSCNDSDQASNPRSPMSDDSFLSGEELVLAAYDADCLNGSDAADGVLTWKSSSSSRYCRPRLSDEGELTAQQQQDLFNLFGSETVDPELLHWNGPFTAMGWWAELNNSRYQHSDTDMDAE